MVSTIEICYLIHHLAVCDGGRGEAEFSVFIGKPLVYSGGIFRGNGFVLAIMSAI